MPLPHPLSPRLDRLRARLAGYRPVTDAGDASLLWAAVAVILVPSPDAVLLIRRSERAGDPWSGHMALPGGRRDAGDPDLVATALRETAEEVGLTLAPADLIGSLDDVVPRLPVLPPIAIRPFVFSLPARRPLRPNAEVAAVQWVPLDQLLDPRAYRLVRLEIRGESREVPAYALADAIVWGLTERILSSLVAQLQPPA